jgi:hypothetical protein
VESTNVILFEDYLKKMAANARKLRVAESTLRFAFGEKNIYNLNIPEFPRYHFNQMFSGFDEVLFTRQGDYLLFANDRLTLINYIVEQNEGKLRQLRDFFTNEEGALLEAFISPRKTWAQMYSSVPHEWQTKLAQHESSYKSMENISLSFLLVGFGLEEYLVPIFLDLTDHFFAKYFAQFASMYPANFHFC